MPSSPTPRSDRMMLVGVGVFALGALAAVAALVPLLVGTNPLPTWAYLGSLLAPLGLAVILVGLWRTARRHGRQTRANRG